MKKSRNEHADTMRQKKYTMPGTDLGETTAIPYNEAYDVDYSMGGPNAKKGPISTMSFSRTDRQMFPKPNPTRWE